MEKGTITVNRYWKRMMKYRPALYMYLLHAQNHGWPVNLTGEIRKG